MEKHIISRFLHIITAQTDSIKSDLYYFFNFRKKIRSHVVENQLKEALEGLQTVIEIYPKNRDYLNIVTTLLGQLEALNGRKKKKDIDEQSYNIETSKVRKSILEVLDGLQLPDLKNILSPTFKLASPFIILFGILNWFAVKTVTFTGVVQDETGCPLPKIKVWTNKSKWNSKETNAAGRFKIRILKKEEVFFYFNGEPFEESVNVIVQKQRNFSLPGKFCDTN